MTSPGPSVPPRLVADDILRGLDEQDREVAATLREYFSHFLPLGKNGDNQAVVVCGNGHELRGGIMGFLLGGPQFEWGIAHGHGHCTECGWPMVGHHYIKDETGAEVATLRNVVLAIHPDFVQEREAVDV